MQVDVAKHLGAVTRTVIQREHQGKPAKVIIATRTYDTTPEDLWDALTSRERLPRWFLPIEGDLKVGGRYQLKGNAGGEILECDQPARLRVTWEMQGQASWVEVTLAPEGPERTKLTLEHVAHVPEEFWGQFGPGAVGVGWELGLLGLALHLIAGPTSAHPDADAWSTTDEGKAYVRGSSDGWGQAHAASGEDAKVAEASAERTRQFYTGEPPPAG